MKFFKNKFLVICLTVAICLTTFSSVMAATGNASFIKDAFGIIATPFRFIFNKTADAFIGFGEYFTEFDRLREENEELRKEHAELERAQAELDVLKEENKWLREHLAIDNRGLEFSLCDATVTGRSASTTSNILTLNKGSLHGIKTGMPVVSSDGVVGKIGEVGLTFCEVICITDISSSIGACIERSALVGICDGALGGECRLSYTTGILDFSAVAEGDILVSSGVGSIFPFGLTIGTISNVKVDEASRSVTAEIIPAVDFENISRVMIITEVKAKEASDE